MAAWEGHVARWIPYLDMPRNSWVWLWLGYFHPNTHNRQSIAHPHGWAMGCLLWVPCLVYYLCQRCIPFSVILGHANMWSLMKLVMFLQNAQNRQPIAQALGWAMGVCCKFHVIPVLHEVSCWITDWASIQYKDAILPVYYYFNGISSNGKMASLYWIKPLVMFIFHSI